MKKLFSFVSILSLLCLSACAQVLPIPRGSHYDTNPPSRIVRFDDDSRSFVIRSGITSPVQIKAVCDLTRDLKNAGLWQRMIAFYPFVGSTSNSTAQNLISTNHGIAWRGTNHFTNGITGDGSSGYGNTGITLTDSDSLHLYAWCATNGFPSSGATATMAVEDGDNSAGLFVETNSVLHTRTVTIQSVQSPYWFPISNYEGNQLLSIGASSEQAYVRGTNAALQLGAVQWPQEPIFISAIDNLGTAQGFSSTTIRAASMGYYLSPNDSTNLFNAVTKFQTALGRNHL
jgi:hypothetical protein